MTAEAGPDTDDLTFKELPEPKADLPTNSARVLHGRLIPPQQQIFLYSSEEWEAFLEEWAHFQKTKYKKIARLSGANDMGIDVAALTSDEGLHGVWDNYQCKHYDDALTPSIAFPEIGKILWYSFKKEYRPPRNYYFSAPRDCGMKLKKLLLNPEKLKVDFIASWQNSCAKNITDKEVISLDGDFLKYVQEFDFRIFQYKPTLELIDEHRKTPYFVRRFGGGLPDRPKSACPPELPTGEESRYLQQLLQAYHSNKKVPFEDELALEGYPDLKAHFIRQREFFYHAESLRNFARDTVPSGTFEELQDEVFAGVVDLQIQTFADGLAYLSATTQAAAELPMTANALIHVTKTQDKRGICHQLANVDRLIWVKS